MAALRKKAAHERAERRWKPVNPHEEKRVGKALLGCVLVFHLLIPFTLVIEVRDTFAIEPLSWFVAMLIISLPLCYIPSAISLPSYSLPGQENAEPYRFPGFSFDILSRKRLSYKRNQRGETTMRFMIIVKATKESEAGVMPSEKLLTEMGQFNEKLVQAGVMLAGEGLHPTSRGARVRFSGDKRTVIDGPFAETKELMAGFWLWQVQSKEEAIEWVKQCPNPHDGDCEIEIRQLFEAEDFGAELTPELREQEERLRAQVGKQQ
jgi:hypothetical protein